MQDEVRIIITGITVVCLLFAVVTVYRVCNELDKKR